MKKGLYYKILSTFIFILFLLLNIAPFSILAQGEPINNSNIFIGYNVYPIQIIEDSEYQTNSSSSSGTFSGNAGYISMLPNSYVANGTFTGEVVYRSSAEIKPTGTINLNLSTNSTLNKFYKGLYKVEIILNNNYVGYLGYDLLINNSQIISGEICYVNGNKAEMNFVLDTQVTNLSSLAIKLNIRDGSLSRINNSTWDFPIESFALNNYLLNKYNDKLSSINEYNNYYLPMFDLSSDDLLYEFWGVSNADYYFILWIDKNVSMLSQVNTYFSLSNGEFIEFTNLQTTKHNNIFGHIVRLKIGNISPNGMVYISLKQNSKVMPIYFNETRFNFISTDFALNFGLSNSFLDNINIIANGTSSSNQSSSNANSTNQSLSQEGQKVENIENQLVSDFDSSMNNISVDSPLNILGSGFVQSANWVRTQFDTLTTNTPFGTLISFSLILGIGLLIIGKVFG